MMKPKKKKKTCIIARNINKSDMSETSQSSEIYIINIHQSSFLRFNILKYLNY